MTDQASEQFDDQLLSAYLDGELTGEELAQVEQRLAADPQARQLVEELRTLSQQVQSLPKETVGEELQASIMQRAERAMLLGAEQPTPLTSSDTGSSRRWMWAVMALAACLLLTIFLPNIQQEEKPVAVAETAKNKQPRAELEMSSAEPEGIIQHNAAQSNSEVEINESDIASDSIAESNIAMEPPQAKHLKAAAPPALSANNEIIFDTRSLACEVHITPNQTADSVQQFGRLLAEQGIEFEKDQAENQQADEQPRQSFAEKLNAQSRQRYHSLTSVKDSDQAEFVLVEAQPEQIENVLAACSADTSSWDSVQLLVESADETMPIKKWRQWERSIGQREQTLQADSVGETQQGFQALRSRAVQSNADQRRSRSSDAASADGNFGKMLSKSIASKRTLKPAVRVLFILQQPEATPTSSAEQPSEKP